MKLDARIAVGLKWESTQEMIGIDSVSLLGSVTSCRNKHHYNLGGSPTQKWN